MMKNFIRIRRVFFPRTKNLLSIQSLNKPNLDDRGQRNMREHERDCVDLEGILDWFVDSLLCEEVVVRRKTSEYVTADIGIGICVVEEEEVKTWIVTIQLQKSTTRE